MPYAAPNNASRYMYEETNIPQMARSGLGQTFIDNYVRSKIRPMDVGGALDQVGMQTYANGMEFSGVGSKLSAGVIARAAGVMSDAEIQAKQMSDQAKLNAQGTMLSMAQHEDEMKLQAERLNLQEEELRAAQDRGGIFGAITSGLQLASAFGGLGGWGLLSGVLRK